MTERQQQWLEAAPERYRHGYQRALLKQCSRSMAIKMKCYECMGWEGVGRTLAAEVRACTSTACPLYAFRPGAAG